MTESVEGTLSRGERKERTRRAMLDAALRLSAENGLATVSLRHVAREAGIVPTAFYRHFDSVEDLGLALVDETTASLREMMRRVRSEHPGPGEIIELSAAVLADQVANHPAHYTFLVRERNSGPPAVRAAVRRQMDLFERDLADYCGRLPHLCGWPPEDLHFLARLIIVTVISAVRDMLEEPERRMEHLRAVIRQIRLVAVGAKYWKPYPTTH